MNGTRSYVVIQRADEKTAGWAKYMPAHTELVQLPGSAIRTPILLLYNIMRRRMLPAAVIVRYLNDYPSIVRTLIRTMSELMTILICVLLGIRVIWLCHNVDRESLQYHPVMSRLRRRLHGQVSHTILVTDQLLVPHAKRLVARNNTTIRGSCFGDPKELKKPGRIDEQDRELIERFVEGAKDGLGDTTLVGFYAGTPDNKKLDTFRLIPDLINAAQHEGIELHFIVVGPIRGMIAKELPEVLDFLSSDPRVLFIGDRYVDIDLLTINKAIDFYWRVYTDLSVPYSTYYAASVRKPILTINRGFLAEMVYTYKLGAVADYDLGNLGQCLHELREWETSNAELFLASHSWAAGARAVGLAALSADTEPSNAE